jgi:hypothetical protein
MSGWKYRCIGTNAYGDDTSSEATLTVVEVPVIDSIRSIPRRDKFWLNAARPSDTVKFIMSTDIGDSTEYSEVYLGRDTTGLMQIVRWGNRPTGKDTIRAIVPANATPNKNFRPVVRTGQHVYSALRTPVTWLEQWILMVKKAVQ